MDNDIKYLDKIINSNDYNYFYWLYPFTNENISGYYSKINFNNTEIQTGNNVIEQIDMIKAQTDALENEVKQRKEYYNSKRKIKNYFRTTKSSIRCTRWIRY